MVFFNSFNRGGILNSLLIGAGFFLSQTSAAQSVSLTAAGIPYSQNFDALSNTAGSTTNNLTISGWFMTESGGGARDNEQYATDTGGSTTGDTYSYGAAGSTDRAFGGLRSGTLIPLIGASFTNNTGGFIGSLEISFYGEEWRLGTAARTDQLNFEYSLNSTDLVTGTWTNVAALNFVTPNTATTGAKDGNLAANQTILTATITGLSIANGATFWIRWVDTDASGPDDGLAIDNFTLTPQAAIPAPEIDVQGNGLSIINGSTSPATSNHTDFGNQSVCSGVITRTFTILNTGTGNLSLANTPVVSLIGSGASSFSIITQPSATIAPGSSSSFIIDFDPASAGTASATVDISSNNDADENPYQFVISGNGVETSISASTQTNVSCNGASTGAISVTATGMPALSYNWEPGTPTGDGTAVVSALAAGVYTVTVTDFNTCTATQTYTITEPTAVSVNITPTGTNICAGNTVTLSASASGGTGTYTYTWSTGENTTDISVTPTSTDTYTINVSDASNCTGTATVSVTVNPMPVISVNSGTICAGESFTINPTGADTYTISGGSTVVSPTSSTSYTVTGTSIDGCVNTTGVVSDVTVNALPVIAVNSGTICAGESFTINATGADTYTISGGTFVVNPNSNTSYTVTGTSIDGCVNTTGAVSDVTVNALPAISISTTNTLLCTGDVATLTATGATSYSWSTTETTDNIVVSPTADTDYTVTGTDANGCTNSATITQSVSVCTGITSHTAQDAFMVYPNPSKGDFNVELQSKATIDVYDLIGNCIIHEQMQAGKNQISLHDQANGIYLLKITLNNKESYTKLIRQ